MFPLDRDNVDTDQIIPKQFLKRVERTGFGQFVFHNWRFGNDDGESFGLDSDDYRDASILVAGENFGCGSSREHAPWALQDYGFKAIIAPSFADIFYSNALKNGIILITADRGQVKEWILCAEGGGLHLDIDLERQIVTWETGRMGFALPPHHRERLLNGWDDIALTLLLEEKIEAYEARHEA